MKTARIFIPNGARLCSAHFAIDSWSDASDHADISQFNVNQIEQMLDLALNQDELKDEFSNIDIHNYTGLTRQEFEDLFSHIPSLTVTMSSEKKAKIALLMLLIRFRKASSYEHIGKLFGISRFTVPDHIEKARTALCDNFVPLHLGFNNLGRNFLLQNSTKSSRILHCENDPQKLVTIWDGTYIFTDKSGNFRFQKETYNQQKSQNFLRPMMCVTTNGYIIDVFGPFQARENDAKCMIKILEKQTAVKEIIMPGDVFIFDRGFRDCLQYIEELDYVVKTPKFVQRNQPHQQLTTEQANLSRIVTKTRFVVESKNGSLKTIFPVFARQWKTICLKTIRKDLRIAAAIINKYFRKVVADSGNEEFITTAMLAKLPTPNIIHPIIQQDLFIDQYTHFIQIDVNNFHFPQICKEELPKITLGTYQLEMAKSYASMHIENSGGEFLCFYVPDEITEHFFEEIISEKNVSEPILVMVRMASRFKNKKTHDSFILADRSKVGASSIIGYYCKCKHGLRTVGCCSHVATTILYLGFARHNGGIRPVAGHVNNCF